MLNIFSLQKETKVILLLELFLFNLLFLLFTKSFTIKNIGIMQNKSETKHVNKIFISLLLNKLLIQFYHKKYH